MILGLALATKHILFIFPLWLAVKQKGFFYKVVMILLPVAIFLLGFIPYLDEGRQGIIQNVFLYLSFNNQIYYTYFVPKLFQLIFSSQMVWIFLLFAFAFFFRKKNGFDSLLLYTCVLVGASPAIANQYLAIAVPFVVANLNISTILYMVFGTWYLMVQGDGLHIALLPNLSDSISRYGYRIMIFLLGFGFVLQIWSQQVNTLLRNVLLEFKIQFGHEKDK